MPTVPPPPARGPTARDGDFSPATKRLLAQRVAMRCSICRAATSSSPAHRARSGSIGVALSICSTSAGDPRFDPTRSVEDRGSAANAIWLCQMCAEWIEGEPHRFSIDELLLLKARAERVALDDPELPDGMAERPWFAGEAFLVPDGLDPIAAFHPDPALSAALTTAGARRALVITGPAGVGKTRHAIEIAHASKTNGGPVLWASASSVTTFARSIDAITDARELGIPVDPAARSETKARALSTWLGSHSRWLFVIDGADSADVAPEIERLLPANHAGTVLVTSRLGIWRAEFEVLALTPWSGREADPMFANVEPSDVARIVAELGGLPLALEQASAYLASTGAGVSDYFQLIESTRRQLIDAGHPAMDDYRASVAVTWQIANTRLSPLARDVLELLSHVASEAVPRALVDALARSPRRRKRKDAVDPQSLAITAALDELAALRLVSVAREDVRMHALLQLVVREHPRPLPWHFSLWRRFYRLPEKAVWERARLPVRVADALARVGTLPWNGPGDARTIEMRGYLAHLEAAAERVPADLNRATTTRKRLMRVVAEVSRSFAPAAEYDLRPIDAARLRTREAFTLDNGASERSRALLTEALALLEDDDLLQYDMFVAAHAFATIADTEADRSLALGYLRRILPRAVELMRFDVAIAFAVPCTVSRLLAAAGDHAAALTVCDEALRDTRSAGDRSRIHRARLWEQRAELLADAGRPMPAARAYRQALAIQRRHATPTRLVQARLLRRGGEMCYQAGRSTLADSQLVEALALLDGAWSEGVEHVENVAGLLGLSLGRVGRSAQAEALFHRALDARASRVGRFHASLAALYRLLGVTLQESGRTAESEPMFRRALNIARVADAASIEDLSRYCDNLAGCLEDLGRPEEAVLLRDEARNARRVGVVPTSLRQVPTQR